jgi:hypothetical protein
VATRLQRAVRAAKPGVAADNKGAAVLLGAFTAVGAIFSALGLTGGLAGRMARNESWLTLIAFGAAALALVCAITGYLLAARPEAQWRAFLWGLRFFVVSAVAAVIAGVLTWRLETSPRVTATVERTSIGEVMDIEVKASGVHVSQRVNLAVWPLASESGPSFSGNGKTIDAQSDYRIGGRALYQTFDGPNADGDLDLSLKVPVPADHPPRVIVVASVGATHPDYCYTGSSKQGCATLDLGTVGSPTVNASWGTVTKRRAMLNLKFTDSDISGRVLRLRMFARKPSVQLVTANVLPDSTGDLDASFLFAVPAGTKRVCVVASTFAESSCPPSATVPASALSACTSALIQTEKTNIAASELAVPSELGNGEERKKIEDHCRASYIEELQHETTWLRMMVPSEGDP